MTEQLLQVPEVARRLGMDGPVVYDLIARGELEAGKGKDGLVYVRESALESYQRRHTATGIEDLVRLEGEDAVHGAT